MKPSAVRERIRCRLIMPEDLGAVASLLREGFKGRSLEWWARGLARMAARDVPDGMPRFGYCIDTGSRLAGVILLIGGSRMIDGAPALFSNVASWYVDPNYRAYAQLLVSIALRNKQVTYTNVTPAPHTWPIVEKQGYTQYCGGLFFAAAALKRPEAGVTIEAFDSHAHADIADHDLLLRHAGWGCRCLVVSSGGRKAGYVFQHFRLKAGKIPTPAMLALHAPDREELLRIAGNLGRYFMWSAAPFIAMDADGPIAGFAGHFTALRGRKYFKGPHRPRLSDLSDTEYAIFGV